MEQEFEKNTKKVNPMINNNSLKTKEVSLKQENKPVPFQSGMQSPSSNYYYLNNRVACRDNLGSENAYFNQ